MKKLKEKGFKMSISLLEVLENAGFDIKKNIDDAKWFLGKRNEFEELCEKAEKLNDLYDEYIDYTLEWDLTPYSFEEWLERRKK